MHFLLTYYTIVSAEKQPLPTNEYESSKRKGVEKVSFELVSFTYLLFLSLQASLNIQSHRNTTRENKKNTLFSLVKSNIGP